MSTSDVTHLQNKWKKKKQLRQLVKAYGYTDPIVLACSQELDRFVYVFMRDYSPRTATCKNDSNSSIELESHYICPLYFTITGLYVD